MNVSPSRIKQLRADNGWSQEQLAEISGLSYRTIQRIEKDGSCSSESHRALASAFSLSPNELISEYKESIGNGSLNSGGILGLFLIVGLVSIQFYLPGSNAIFFDFISLLLVCGITFSLSAMSSGLHETVEALQLVKWLIVEPENEINCQRYLPILRRLIAYSYSSGIVSTLIGSVAVFSAAEEYQGDIMQGIAIACLTMVYGVVLAEFIFRPVKNKLTYMLSISE